MPRARLRRPSVSLRSVNAARPRARPALRACCLATTSARLYDRDVVAVGVAQHEQEGSAWGLHRLGVEVDPAEGLEALVLGLHVGRLDADAAAAGLAPHRRIEGEASRRARGRHLDPAVLAVGPERGVAADLEAQFLRVEGDG